MDKRLRVGDQDCESYRQPKRPFSATEMSDRDRRTECKKIRRPPISDEHTHVEFIQPDVTANNNTASFDSSTVVKSPSSDFIQIPSPDSGYALSIITQQPGSVESRTHLDCNTNLSPFSKENDEDVTYYEDTDFLSSEQNSPTSVRSETAIRPTTLNISRCSTITDCGTATTIESQLLHTDEKHEFSSDQYESTYIENCLTDQFTVVKDAIEPSEITDILQSEGVISNSDAERINESRHRRDKCDILVKAIARCLKTNDKKANESILRAFHSKGYTYIFTDFKQKTEDGSKTDKGKCISKVEIERRLDVNITELENEIDPYSIVDELVAERILTLTEHEDILRTTLKHRKNQCIIEYVKRKPEHIFWRFCGVLDTLNPLLADKLRNGDNGQYVAEFKSTSSVNLAFQHAKTTMHESPNDKGETEVKMVFSGDGQDVERMIVDENSTDSNIQLQVEAMETGGFDIDGYQFSSIRIKLSGLSRYSQVEFLRQCNNSPSFLTKWIQSVIKEHHIKILKEKHIDKISFQIVVSLPKPEDSSCQCTISKEIIRREMHTLQTEMRNIDEIISCFKTFEGFTDETKKLFGMIPREEVSKAKMFLDLLLDIDEKDIGLCLFESEMRKTNIELFQRITRKQPEHKEISIANIMENEAMLLEELEPKQFRDMLAGIPGSEEILKITLSSQSRRTKCKELLKFIVQHGGSSIAMFVKELERQKKPHILDQLSHDKQAEESLREAIIRRYKDIVDEIEPRSFKHMFLERQQSAKQEIDAICNFPTRKLRAIRFLRFILKNTHFLCHLFMQSMELSGCSHIVQMLSKELETYKECPRLYISKLGVKRRIEIAGEFQLWFTEDQGILKSKVVHQPGMQNAEGKNDINQTREKHTSNTFQIQRTMEWVDKHLDQRARWDDEEPNRDDSHLDFPSLFLGIGDLGSDLDIPDSFNDLFDTDCKFDFDDMSVTPSNKSAIVTRHDEAYDLSSLSTVTHRAMSSVGGKTTIDMLLDDGLTCDSLMSQHTLNNADYKLNYRKLVCRYPGNPKPTRNDTDIDMIDCLNKALENVGDLSTEIPTFEKCNRNSSLSTSGTEDTEHSLEKFLDNLSENVESQMTQQSFLSNKLPKPDSEAGEDHMDTLSRIKSNTVFDTDEPNLVDFSDTLPRYEYKQRPEKPLIQPPIEHDNELNKSLYSIPPLILKGISKETGTGDADNITISPDGSFQQPRLDESIKEPAKEGKTGINFYTIFFDEAEDHDMYKLLDDKIVVL